jgi:tetratricopeptide (TPR) repeat protein
MRSLFIAVIATLLFAVSSLAQAQKVIKDPAEYNAYVSALNTQDPDQKAAAMEAFIDKYPNSVVKVDAMEHAMAAYQAVGKIDKVGDIAAQILKLDQNNVRALAIATFLKRNQATTGKADLINEIKADATLGLQALPGWQKPADMSDDDFKKVRDQMASIFYGASGFVALQSKDFTSARDYYSKSVQIDPKNLQDVYQLGIAELEMKPIDPNGFWYIAKAENLIQNEAGRQSINNYGKAKYHNYHGGDDGWDKILSAVADQSAPPEGFASSIKRAPTPADLAVMAVEQNDLASMSFSDWEFILSFRDASPANKAAADKVWKAIQDKQKNGAAKLSIPAKVISVSGNTILAAISDDNQEANRADVQVMLEKPSSNLPAPGSQIKIIGVLTDYTPKPFMLIMKQAEIGS